jgi:murein DD-endopeptidase MepM/ murein hydrolase activator NlpD
VSRRESSIRRSRTWPRAAWLALLVGAAAPATAAAGAVCALALPQRIEQGSLVIARIAPECRATFGEHALRVGPDGEIVFGLGRDAPSPQTLALTDGTGKRHEVAFAVAKRTYDTERVDGVPPATVEPPPEIAARIAREQAAVAAARVRDDDRRDYLARFEWPVHGRISGHWGNQRILNGKPKDPHPGFDIAAPAGTPVKAPAPGVVIFAAPDLYLTGGTLVVDHGHGVSSTFIHLSRLDVKVGDRVAQGQAIAAVGATGRATGPHLHWGMNWFETRVDPEKMLP